MSEFGDCVTAMLWPKKATKRNWKVPTNSPVAAMKWFRIADWAFGSRGAQMPHMGALQLTGV